MSYRTADWPKCPCDDCAAEHKLIDEYGYFCDLACGQRSQWIQREAGADAMLEALKQQGEYWGKIVEKPYFSTTRRGWLVFVPDDVCLVGGIPQGMGNPDLAANSKESKE